MTTKSLTTNVVYVPRRYQVGKNGSWTLTVYQDGIMVCTCPDAQIRRHQCKHQTAYVKGEITSKPRIAVRPLPLVRRAVPRESREAFEAHILSLDV